jgi:branched-chain amino acid transport system substrate-binding protein
MLNDEGGINRRKITLADVLMDFATVKAVAQAVRKTDDIGWRPLQFVASGGSFVTTALKPAGLE